MREIDRDHLGVSAEFSGRCPICGFVAIFQQTQPRVRETFVCPSCRGSARYQVQAYALVQAVTGSSDLCLRECVEAGLLSGLRIYEVGISGPFRPFLSGLSGYTNSFFWPDVAPGAFRDRIVCQDLTCLTFPTASFDLVITSDILEHVRHPERAFAEIGRVLAMGGHHVFTVPTNVPFSRPTVKRVDVSGQDDVYILPANYHGDGKGGRSLVYNDFGSDIINMILDFNMQTRVFFHPAGGSIAEKCLSFVSEAIE